MSSLFLFGAYRPETFAVGGAITIPLIGWSGSAVVTPGTARKFGWPAALVVVGLDVPPSQTGVAATTSGRLVASRIRIFAPTDVQPWGGLRHA
jgi:hypothetical protein